MGGWWMVDGGWWLAPSSRRVVSTNHHPLFVIFPILQFLRKAYHVRSAFFVIVSVFVSFAVAKTLHQSGRRVAQVERHGFALRRAGVFGRGLVSHTDLVRFGSAGEIDGRFGQCQTSFGESDQMRSLRGRGGKNERLRVGQADVFGGMMNDTARDVHRIFVGFDHSGQPVERRVWVGIADRFYES